VIETVADVAIDDAIDVEVVVIVAIGIGLLLLSLVSSGGLFQMDTIK